MRSNRDITSSLILIIIILVISALVYYLFFYSGSKPQTTPQEQKMDQDIFSAPFLSPNTIFEKRKGKERPPPKIAEKPSKNADSPKKKDGDRDTSPKKSEQPFTDFENQENIQALDQIRIDIDNFVAFINQRSLQQFSQEMITGYEISGAGNKLTIYIANPWYYLPPFQKQYMFNLVALSYAKQACLYKIRTECSADDFPTINFLNQENREVAKMAAHQPLQIYE